MKRSIFTVLFIAVTMTFYSCESIPSTPPADDLTDREIIQLAQNAYDLNHKKVAEYYYKILLQRFGNYTEDYIEGRFELAHLYLKQKKYDLAVPMLQEIIEIYDTSVPGSLPGQYIVLAKADLEKVPEKKMAEILARQESDNASYDASYDDDYYDGNYYDESEYNYGNGYDEDAYYYEDDSEEEDDNSYNNGFGYNFFF